MAFFPFRMPKGASTIAGPAHIEAMRPFLERDVADEHTEADGDEQERLEVLFDGQVDEEAAHEEHYDVGPLAVGEPGEPPEGLYGVLQKGCERGRFL